MTKNYLIITRALTHGGAERTAVNLANELTKHRNVILVTLNADRATYETDVKIINLGMPIHDKGNKIKWYLELIKRVKKIKKQYNIDYSISFLLEPDIANVFSNNGDKKIISIRNKQSELFRGFLRKIRDNIIFLKADKIIAISKMVKSDLENNYLFTKNKTEVIYNFANEELIKEKISKDLDDTLLSIDFERYPTIVNVGRLSEQKGQWHLIRAFSLVVEKEPSAKLIILGEGKLEKYLKQLAKNLGIENSVVFGGYQSNPYPIMHRAGIFVFSSLFEGLGNSLIESLVCSTPIISTDCDSGPREIIYPSSDPNLTGTASTICYGDYGILVPCFDGIKYSANDEITREEKILSNSILELISNEELYQKYKKSTKIRIEDFENSKIIKEWINLVEGCKNKV